MWHTRRFLLSVSLGAAGLSCIPAAMAQSPSHPVKMVEVEWKANVPEGSDSPSELAPAVVVPEPAAVSADLPIINPVAGRPTMLPAATPAAEIVRPFAMPVLQQPTPTSAPVITVTQVAPPAVEPAPAAATTGTTFPPLQDNYAPSRVWASADYLHWWLRGNGMPPLVTAAPIGVLGTLDNPATRVIYGNQQANANGLSGMQFGAGFWFDPCATCGVEANFFLFGTNNQNFAATSAGGPGLFRPFTDPGGLPDAQLVAYQAPRSAGGFDPILTGSVAVNNSTNFYGWDTNFRKMIYGDCNSRLDFLIGYRYMRLQDSTSIGENLLATDPLEVSAPLGTRILVFDQFQTTNTFNGGQIGLAGERRYGRWVASFRALVALGDTHEQVKINGQTTVITPTGVSQSYPGGLLALPSNIGSYSADYFGVISQVAGNIGYQVTPHFRIFGGYTFLNWSGVARSGGQIDTVVNPTQLPNNGPAMPPNRPAFHLNQTDFYAHGYNVGFMVTW